MTSRASIWDGTEWLTMTGGTGDGGGGGEPDDNYLRLDGANNPAAPNDFIRSGYVDGKFLPLLGGTMVGTLTVAAGTTLLHRAQNASSLTQGFDPNDDTQFRWRLGGTSSRRIYSFQIVGDDEIASLSDSGHLFSRSLDMSSNQIKRVANPSVDTDGMSRGYNDGRYLSLTANAVSASKWLTARTITFTGNTSGSVALDGSGNVTANLAVSGFLALSGGTLSGEVILGGGAQVAGVGGPGWGGAVVRNIMRGNTVPTAGEGSHGDIYVQYA